MKETGIVRRIDDLGRVVIPKAVRKDMNMTEGEPLEIYQMGDCAVLRKYQEDGKPPEISDGYHTFKELYYHRMMLFAVICNHNKDKAWKSWKHHDGTMFDDMFIVGVETPEGHYTYHYNRECWDVFDVKELESAPEWDGHQPKDITRLLSL